MAHTPGPWSQCNSTVYETANGTNVAIASGENLADKFDNARLIAAAPEMLEAMELVEKWWLEKGMEYFDGAPAAIFAVRAAIAKAKGDSHVS